MSNLHAGLRGEVTLQVTSRDTAEAMGSGSVPVFATPRLVALLEHAAVKALGHHLDPDQTTVGTRIEVSHLAATPVGGQVRAQAELVQVEGRTLTFEVSAFDDQEKIAEGRHQRFIVVTARFLARTSAKRSSPDHLPAP